ncbi:MAG: hypothetical protein Q7R82_01115 [Candidatus Daviesbacteria bacterium]|nr:hypothetical protein [Candidatus Daviesbacteria bacterium]
METLTSFAEYEARIRPEIAGIIKSYRRVAGEFDKLWKAISVRSDQNFWRLPERQGIGSCTGDSGLSISGPARPDLFELRKRRNREAEGIRLAKACEFHRAGKGCVLGDLKSPLCLEYVDKYHETEMQNRFDISMLKMEPTLLRILSGNAHDDLVQAAVENIQNRIKYIEVFPILHPEEI